MTRNPKVCEYSLSQYTLFIADSLSSDSKTPSNGMKKTDPGTSCAPLPSFPCSLSPFSNSLPPSLPPTHSCSSPSRRSCGLHLLVPLSVPVSSHRDNPRHSFSFLLFRAAFREQVTDRVFSLPSGLVGSVIRKQVQTHQKQVSRTNTSLDWPSCESKKVHLLPGSVLSLGALQPSQRQRPGGE